MPSTPLLTPDQSQPLSVDSVDTPVMVISPHYDDAVFSCGHLLAAMPGSTVVTVFTAVPPEATVRTDWDLRCGFDNAEHAMRIRRNENQKALGALDAKGVDLSFLDGQYLESQRNSMDLLADTLLSTILEFQPKSIFMPLGLFHADHLMVADVTLLLQHRLMGLHWYAYADIPYNKDAERAQQRLEELAGKGVHCEWCDLQLDSQRKARAVDAYRSQFRGLGHADGLPILAHQEQYWRLHQNPELL